MKLIKKYFPYNILFVLFLIILYFSPICGDDWGNYLVGKMGLFTDIKNAVGMYFVWEGRFISRILINILTYHKLLWNIVNSLVIISIIYLMVKIINPKDKRRVIILSILTILFMNILMFSQVVTWVAGNITYLFVIPFFLSYIYIIINGKDKGNIVYVTIFLNIIMTMFIEHMGVLLVFFNLFINVIYYLKNKKINKKYIMYFIISLLSFSLMFFSPGNKERNMVENTYFNKLNIFEKIKYNFNNFINYTFVYNPYLLILMSISNYYLMKENIRNKGIRICASIFFIIPLIYTIITYFVAVFQNTSYTSNIYLNIYFIIYIVMEFVLIYRYSKKEEKLKREKAEKETEAKLKEMEENISDNAEMLNKQSVSVGSLSAEMEMLKKELSYESSDTALKELENIRNKIEVLEKRKRELDENILKSDRTKSNLNGTIKENKNQLETDRKNLETEYDDFIKVLKEKEFENEEAYNESLVHIESIEIFDRQIQEYKEEVSKVSSLISVLDDMLDGEKEIDTDVMLQQKAEMEIEAERLANENEITVSKLGTNNSVRDKVSKLMEQRGKLNEKYKIISSLNNVANSKKIHFQTFVLRQYFNMVISYANKRLAVMTSNGFLLKCRDISLTTAGETGLELDVYSPVTGKVRDAHSLSGGETFMASLAMALGMSDIVQNNSGKTQIDTMFIDEGFGSLSDDVRDKAVKILLDLAGSSRLVGVISHVSELKEQIPSKIIVRKDNDGSHITWVQDR